MRRRSLAFSVNAAIWLALSGCSHDPYQEVMQKQIDNWNAVTEILKDVKDKDSMDDAESLFMSRRKRIQESARQASQLKTPTAEQFARFEPERLRMQEALNRMKQEMDRIKTLPGGPEFFERIGKMTQITPSGWTP